jgi:amino acid transporter
MQPTQPPGLVRVLGPWMATALVVGTVIGTGVFKKARNVTAEVPEFGPAISVWVVVGLLTLLGALALAEVAVLFPRAGGNYVFLREGYGRWAGFLWGWVEFWIIRSASIGALAVMFTESFHDVLRQALYPGEKVEVLSFWVRQLLTVLVIGTLAGINIRGTRLSGGVQLFITLLKVGSILFITVLPFAVLAVVSEPSHPPRVEYLSPVWPAGRPGVTTWAAYGTAMVAVLWAYNGWMNLGPVAEEVKDPQRNIPRSLLLAVLILIGLYVGAQVAYYLVMPREEVAAVPGDTAVATVFCAKLLGPVGVVLASAILMTSAFGALNGNLLVGPRLLFAMGRDRLVPQSFERLHPRYGTPALAIAVMAGWSCLLVLGVATLVKNPLPGLDLSKKDPFDIMTDFVIFGSVTFETLAVASIFLFRWKLPPTPENRPYRCWGYPVVPLVYVLAMGAVLFNMFASPDQRTEALIGMGFIGVGAVVYVAAFRGRRAA